MSQKVFYKGSKGDFILFIDSESALEQWKKDSTVPLSDVVSKFQIFKPVSGFGSEGELETPSKQDLDIEFHETNVDEIIIKILKNGEVLGSKGLSDKGKYASTNDSKGSSGIADHH